ncbi:unnamed protein product [Medioppia subpectinata]|uniref:Nuclear condensin complex subunit 3 C-terminal domain-containing protein n=1 Tax=Medioppia subpectinata TaxID=1979941 RepID=A0A7R9PVS2_9ACAR|nr:unnamed protein product [Medioppia subpectinata]CAG2103145.1 unnamed protein product [Medioppia subpectinata]
MIDILSNEELFNRIHNYVQHLMKIFAKNSDLSVYLEKTVELIDAINCQSIGEDDAPPPPSQPTQEVVLSADELKQLEIDYARLSIRVESLKDDLESAERNDSQSEADSIRALIAEYTGKMNDIMEKRLRVNVTQMPFNSQQSSQMSQNENRTQKTLTDDPIALERCLQIFNGCLEFGDFKAPHPMILTLIDKFVIPCILVPEIKVRERAVNCLGLSCLLSQELAKKHFALFVQILNFDSDLPQETALKCLFDLLCVHGLSSFDYKSKNRSFNKSKNIIIDDDENGSNDKENQSVHNNSTRRRSGATNDGTESMDEDEDNDRTIINETGLDVLCSDSEAGDQEDVDEEDTFINLFTELLEKHLNSEMDSIKLITSQGIGKLFILGRMYSPQLLSKMILLWYDPDSSEELRQFLGVFLPIYSGVRMKANLKGENAFEECFLKTVEVDSQQ